MKERTNSKVQNLSLKCAVGYQHRISYLMDGTHFYSAHTLEMHGPGPGQHMKGNFSKGPGQQMRDDFSNGPGRAGK